MKSRKDARDVRIASRNSVTDCFMNDVTASLRFLPIPSSTHYDSHAVDQRAGCFAVCVRTAQLPHDISSAINSAARHAILGECTAHSVSRISCDDKPAVEQPLAATRFIISNQ
jgi:hypothetical protein